MSNAQQTAGFTDTFQKDMDEAVELLEMSHSLFQKKLVSLEEQTKIEKDTRKKDDLKKKALVLFSEYKNSLQVIEKYIEEAYEKNKGK